MHQIAAVGPDVVVLKIFFDRNDANLHQVDFIVPRSEYEKQAANIESSIGSVAIADLGIDIK